MPWLLLIDDDAGPREELATFLRRRGHEVRTAEDGADALERLQRHPTLPSVILLDLMMPVMNGWEFRSAQLIDPELADIPVIVMTGANARDPGGALQATTYLRKPIDLDALLSSIAVHSPPELDASGRPRRRPTTVS